MNASSHPNDRTTAYLVPSRANTERKAVMTRNQVTTLTSGPWFSGVSHSGASVVVRLEMPLIMLRAFGQRDEGVEVLRSQCQQQVWENVSVSAFSTVLTWSDGQVELGSSGDWCNEMLSECSWRLVLKFASRSWHESCAHHRTKRRWLRVMVNEHSLRKNPVRRGDRRVGGGSSRWPVLRFGKAGCRGAVRAEFP